MVTRGHTAHSIYGASATSLAIWQMSIFKSCVLGVQLLW